MRFMRILAVGVAVVLLAAAGACAQDVTLSVAISLKGVTEELGRSFMAAHPGVTLRYNFGASGDLQKQIEAGAPIVVFLSAAQRQMDELEKQNLIVAASRRAFARNVLTVIKPADSRIDITKPAELLDARVGRIAIGNPKTVPAGQYAEESLRSLGLWDRVQPKDLVDARLRLDHFIAHYNHFRTHQGIDGLVPADRFFGAGDALRGVLEKRMERDELKAALSEAPRQRGFQGRASVRQDDQRAGRRSEDRRHRPRREHQLPGGRGDRGARWPAGVRG